MATGIAAGGAAAEIRSAAAVRPSAATAATVQAAAATVVQAVAAVRPEAARFDRTLSAWQGDRRSTVTDGKDGRRSAVEPSATDRAGERGGGGAALAAFLAQSFAQSHPFAQAGGSDGETAGGPPSRSLQQAGAAAYRRTAATGVGGQSQIEMVLPPLSSGRALDLTV